MIFSQINLNTRDPLTDSNLEAVFDNVGRQPSNLASQSFIAAITMNVCIKSISLIKNYNQLTSHSYALGGIKISVMHSLMRISRTNAR